MKNVKVVFHVKTSQTSTDAY